MLFWPLFRQIVFPQNFIFSPPSNIDWTLIEITFWLIGIYSRDQLGFPQKSDFRTRFLDRQREPIGKPSEKTTFSKSYIVHSSFFVAQAQTLKKRLKRNVFISHSTNQLLMNVYIFTDSHCKFSRLHQKKNTFCCWSSKSLFQVKGVGLLDAGVDVTTTSIESWRWKWRIWQQ